jgi:hypothetical protein
MKRASETRKGKRQNRRRGWPGLFEISASVGRGGENLEEDVLAVQAALNRRADADLPGDGQCGPATLAAIIIFQQALGQSKPDGRVDPGRGTAGALAACGKIGKPPAPRRRLAPPEDLGEATLARAPQVWHGTRNVQRVDVIPREARFASCRDAGAGQCRDERGPAQDRDRERQDHLADYLAFVKNEPSITSTRTRSASTLR